MSNFPRSWVLELQPPPDANRKCNHYRAQRALQKMLGGGEFIRLPRAVVDCFPDHLRPELIKRPRTGPSYWGFSFRTDRLRAEAYQALMIAGWRPRTSGGSPAGCGETTRLKRADEIMPGVIDTIEARSKGA